jgi:hypothetical protein
LFTEKEKIETCVLPTEREIDQGFRNWFKILTLLHFYSYIPTFDSRILTLEPAFVHCFINK